MAKTAYKGRRVCVTCQYWAGPRSINRAKSNAEYEKNNVIGMCAGGKCDRGRRTAIQSCSGWTKWSAFS